MSAPGESARCTSAFLQGHSRCARDAFEIALSFWRANSRPDLAMAAKIRKLLVANRGEIAIRVFRAANELGIRTVAIYSHEDRFALHRFKADEAYQVGTRQASRSGAYLNIEAIIARRARKRRRRDPPGLRLPLRERRVRGRVPTAGITFVGPTPELLDMLGDKVGRAQAGRRRRACRCCRRRRRRCRPTSGGARRLAGGSATRSSSRRAMGGGGRGMRVVESADAARRSARPGPARGRAAFGVADVFLEKYIRRAKHIEVQILGDTHGNLVHLFERDCSVQRRHQKVVEIAPAYNLDRRAAQRTLRRGRCGSAAQSATTTPARSSSCVDVETGKFYFIEVNPRIQVEHTVTEIVTGIDLVKSQILIAAGAPLGRPRDRHARRRRRSAIHGYAIQCRITTEDPANNFIPDYGRITHYRSPRRLRHPPRRRHRAITGAIITPFYDSLLVKVTACGAGSSTRDRADGARARRSSASAASKTNIPFLLNVIDPPGVPAPATLHDPVHRRDAGAVPVRRRGATGRRKLLTFSAEVIVNGFPEVNGPATATTHAAEPRPPASRTSGRRRRRARATAASRSSGPEKFAEWVREQKPLLLTDTTFRDAHQSLLATRVRTCDMLRDGRRATPQLLPGLFSLEMWGGATFDTSMRFLKEDPWDRLAQLREKIPNILFQMLLRGSNAVGYTNYPDNVVRDVRQGAAAAAGIDVFRVFDSLNWVANMEVALEAVREAGALCEAAICYTGDILDPARHQVRPEVLRRAGQGAGEAAGATSSPSRTWPGCASRTRPSSWSRRSRGGRHADPLPHPRHRRRAGAPAC